MCIFISSARNGFYQSTAICRDWKRKNDGDLKKEVTNLSLEVCGKDILQEIKDEHAETNPLMAQAHVFTLLSNVKNNLKKMKSENKKINLESMGETRQRFTDKKTMYTRNPKLALFYL